MLSMYVDRTRTVEVARAEAQKIKLIGASDASAIECVGKAEAEMMRLKAAAYKQYGKAATLSLVLDCLPKVIFVQFQSYQFHLCIPRFLLFWMIFFCFLPHCLHSYCF